MQPLFAQLSSSLDHCNDPSTPRSPCLWKFQALCEAWDERAPEVLVKLVFHAFSDQPATNEQTPPSTQIASDVHYSESGSIHDNDAGKQWWRKECSWPATLFGRALKKTAAKRQSCRARGIPIQRAWHLTSTLGALSARGRRPALWML